MPTADVLNIQVKLSGVQQAVRDMDRLQQKMNQMRGARTRGGGSAGGHAVTGGGGGRGFWVADALQATGILLRGAEQVGTLMVSGAKAAVKAYEGYAGFKMGAQALLGAEAGKEFAIKFQEFAIPAIYNTDSLRKAGLQMAAGLGASRGLKTLQNVTDILAGTGMMDREAADSVFLALQQTAGKGKLTGEEFTRQLSNAAPAFAQLLIKEAGGLDKLIPGGGKPGMSADKFFALIDRIAAKGGFEGAQQRLADQSPSLRWGQIMDLLEAKLIPVGEKFATGLMRGLGALENGVKGINWEALAATAEKWGQKTGDFLEFLAGKLPEIQKWISNLDIEGISAVLQTVVNSMMQLGNIISGNEGLIVAFIALAAAARTIAAIIGSLRLIAGEAGIGALIKGIGGKGGGGLIARLLGRGGAAAATSVATNYLPALPGSVAAGGAGIGSSIAGFFTASVTGTIASVAGAVLASAAVAAASYKLTRMGLDALTGGDYEEKLARDFARRNGATVDENGNESYLPSIAGKLFSDESRKRAATGSGPREMERRRQRAEEAEAGKAGISPEYYQALKADIAKSKARPVRHDDIRRIIGRAHYDTLRRA